MCGLLFVSLLQFCCSVCLYHAVYYSSVVQFEIRNGDTSCSSLLFRNILSVLDLLCFHMKPQMVLSSSVKNCVGILMEILLNLWIAFGRVIITNL